MVNQIILLRKVVLGNNQNYIAVVNAKNILECISSFGDYNLLKEINSFDELKTKLDIITSDDEFIYSITITNEDFSHKISNENSLLQNDVINIDTLFTNNDSPTEAYYNFEIHEDNGSENYLYENTFLNTNNQYIKFENNTFKFLIQKDADDNPVNIFKGEKFVIKIVSNNISNLIFDFNNLEYETILVVAVSDNYDELKILQNSMSLLITEHLPRKIYYNNYYITVSVFNQDQQLIKTLSKVAQIKKEVTP